MQRSVGGFVLALAIAAGIASAVHADGPPFEQTTFLAPLRVEGVDLDIAGISSGMGASVALSILNTITDMANISRVDREIAIGSLRSKPFAALYHTWSVPSDQINVYLTSPASGNEVFAVTRRQTFGSEATRPDYGGTIRELEGKYGLPSGTSDRQVDPISLLQRGRTTTLAWYFGGRRACDVQQDNVAGTFFRFCEASLHRTGEAGLELILSPDRLDEYRLAASAGSEIVIVATLRNDGEGHPVTSLTVSLIDLQRRLAAAQADVLALADMARQAQAAPALSP